MSCLDHRLLSFLLLYFHTASAHEDLRLLLGRASTLGRFDLNFTWHVESIVCHLFELFNWVLASLVLPDQVGLELVDFRILCLRVGFLN